MVRVIRRAYSFSIIALLFAGVCFCQKPSLNPLSRMFFFTQNGETEAPLDSDGDGLPDGIETSGYAPLQAEFAWRDPLEGDLFLPWQRFTVKNDAKPFAFENGFTFNGFNQVFVSPTGYLSFGKPLNDITPQEYPLTDELRRTIPQIAFAQGDNALIPQLGSKFYFSPPATFTFEKLFLGGTNSFASIQATLHPDGRIGLFYKDIDTNLAQTRRIGWQMNSGGFQLTSITNHTALLLQPFTPTDPNSPDSDGDGLTDWEELFIYGTNPMNPSTAGDDFPDGWKVLHGLSPTIPYPADTSVGSFGPDWPGEPPTIKASDIPLLLHVKTNQPAWLTFTWSNGTSHRMPIQGGAGQSIPFGLASSATISIEPATGAVGPWSYSLRAESLAPDTPILHPSDETPHPRGISTLERQGLEWLSGGTALLSTEATPEGYRNIKVFRINAPETAYHYCVIHHTEEVCLAPPPPEGDFLRVDWHSVPSQLSAFNSTELRFTPTEVPPGAYILTATCQPKEPGYPRLLYTIYLEFGYWVSAAPLTLRGAAEFTGHEPGNRLDGSEGSSAFCHHCWVKESTILVVGFDHEKTNTRNLPPHPDETAASRDIKHCIGIDYTAEGIDLSQFLHETSLPFLSEFSWDADGEILHNPPRLHISKPPKDLYPEIREIYLRNRKGDIIYDHLFLIILDPKSRNNFINWQDKNTDISWVNALPFPPKALIYTGSGNFPLYHTPDDKWKAPGYFYKSYYHHIAYLDIRTREAVNGHGHQACYDENGLLITSGVSAGSADWAISGTAAHREEDVHPFIRALQLDGNPIHPTNGFGGIGSTVVPTRLTRPFIYEGVFTKAYLQLRPPHVQ